jgi:peptide deformylase
MTYRKVLKWPDTALRKESQPVGPEEEILEILNDLEDTLRVEKGLGIAAPQIGVHKYIFIIDTATLDFDPPDDDSPLEDKNLWVVINPSLFSPRGEEKMWREGCLSVPYHSAEVSRAEKIGLQYFSFTGNVITVDLLWPVAGIVQHEYDHLRGKLFIDRLSRLKSGRIKKSILKKQKKLEKIKKQMLESDEQQITKMRKNSHLRKKEIKKRKRNKKVSRV